MDREGPVGALLDFSGLSFALVAESPGLTGTEGGTEAVARVARGPAGGGRVTDDLLSFEDSVAGEPCLSAGPVGGAELPMSYAQCND